MDESRGSIAFFTSYRPPVPLDIFCCQVPPSSRQSELHLTDGLSYNYNCRPIPPAALKTIIKRLRLAPEAVIDDDVDSGQVTGLVFVSEREHNLETLHVALRFVANGEVKVFSLADIYGANLFGTFDISPSVSPSGKKVAVASFQGKRWDGEIKDLKTNIYVMGLENPSLERKRVIENGGWPSWGGENVIFFHRKVGDIWGVFQYNLSIGETIRLTPEAFDAVTPAAIDETRVAVATIRQKYIGYHRCKSDILQHGDDVPKHFHKVQSPHEDVGVFRVSGVFPTFSKDGSKLAFVDNEFKAVWLADSKGLRVVFETNGPDSIFSPVWNQKKDILYVCMGPSFKANETLEIHAIPDVSSAARVRRQPRLLTKGKFNNAFPFTNPDGTKFVFRSTRDGGDKKYKNLYIMEDAEFGEPAMCQSATTAWTGPGYFAVYLMNVSDRVVVRVIRSGYDLSDHVNHPVRCPPT
ncbi:hypothetical protein BAE44_0004977 [Dichanthelium oligosanthes]|uniref:Protein TolB n=1 Tax=Dichanthelium oligosanthes TaxID=888268 RepID=A0A1E5W9A5_9POAL|nr:hypothetical protein BAE44_0004977 [Dichanthelium oligosanthes]